MPHDEVSSLIYAGQVRVVFRQMPTAVAVNAVIATLTVIVLASISIDWLLLTWFGLLILVTLARGVLWRRYWTAKDQGSAARRWAVLATISSGLTGLAWGCGGGALAPMVTFEQMFIVFVVGGMCIGAVAVSSAHLPTLFAFLFSASLPI